ncbi:hypothetical protein [Nonomuraea sp. NPDC049028]|uniref:hypothetical protein n=1 Tax=Nonomuraea sp. NPDC049028 TaxID=3364348 RepID=UPI003718CC92
MEFREADGRVPARREALVELHGSLDRRYRPEDVADLVLRALDGSVSRRERVLLERAAKHSAHRQGWFSSMSTDYARPVGGARVRDGDDADFHEIMTEIHAETTRLAIAYRACAEALSDFADSVELARTQASGARSWAENAREAHSRAVRSFRILASAPDAPGGDWRALDEFMAEELIRDLSDPYRRERSVEVAREAREWEEERQEAKRSALKAISIRAEAETRCVEAIRSVVPPGVAHLAAVDERDAVPVLPPVVESLPDASEIERLLAGLDGTP